MAIYFILWVITQYYHFIYLVVQVVLALAIEGPFGGLPCVSDTPYPFVFEALPYFPCCNILQTELVFSLPQPWTQSLRDEPKAQGT